MKPLAALLFITALTVSSPASAQFNGGWSDQLDRLSTMDPTAVSPEWRACTNEEYRYSVDEVVAGCGRAIENASRPRSRAMALWWRAFAYDRTSQIELARADYQAALAEFDTWSRDDPRSIDAHFNRASMLISMREYDQALAELAVADRMLRRQPRIHASIGRVAFLRGDYATAIAEFDQADRLGRHHNFGIVSHNRCEARAAAGVELELARTICDRAVRDSANNPSVLTSRGFFRFRQGDLDGALADFERALSADANNPGALYGRATVKARTGQQEAAAADLARSLELSPRTAEYYGNAGMRPN